MCFSTSKKVQDQIRRNPVSFRRNERPSAPKSYRSGTYISPSRRKSMSPVESSPPNGIGAALAQAAQFPHPRNWVGIFHFLCPPRRGGGKIVYNYNFAPDGTLRLSSVWCSHPLAQAAQFHLPPYINEEYLVLFRHSFVYADTFFDGLKHIKKSYKTFRNIFASLTLPFRSGGISTGEIGIFVCPAR